MHGKKGQSRGAGVVSYEQQRVSGSIRKDKLSEYFSAPGTVLSPSHS